MVRRKSERKVVILRGTLVMKGRGRDKSLASDGGVV